MTNENNERLKAASLLKEAQENIGNTKFLIGFDGFVDQIIDVVDTRTSVDEYSRINTIKEYGERIVSAAGKSANLELVPKIEKMGGNGPLMANAVVGCGNKVTLIGLFGLPEVWPIFKQLESQCNLISCGNPGTTDALEFKDGKIMMGKQNTMKDLNWENICNIIGEEKFMNMLLANDLVAITNWTELVELTSVIENIAEKLPENSGLTFFFDLADPEKRLESEIAHVMHLVSAINKKAKCVLGLNFREAEQVSKVMKIDHTISDGIEGLQSASAIIKKKLDIHGIVVHSVKFAGATVENNSAAVAGPFCETPKITTGAGDHFNGGFCSALMAKLPLKSALLAGVATSGWYVRNGGPSPTVNDATNLLTAWANNELE